MIKLLVCFPAWHCFHIQSVRDGFGWDPARLGQRGYPAVFLSINLLLNTVRLIHTLTHSFTHLLVSIIADRNTMVSSQGCDQEEDYLDVFKLRLCRE